MRQLPDLITWVSGETSGSHPGLRSHSLVLVGFTLPCQPKCRACCLDCFSAAYQVSRGGSLVSVCTFSFRSMAHPWACVHLSFSSDQFWLHVDNMTFSCNYVFGPLCSLIFSNSHLFWQVWRSGVLVSKSLFSLLFKESSFMGRLS